MCFEGVRLLGAVSPRVRVEEKTILHMADTQAEFSIDDKHEGEIRAKTENTSPFPFSFSSSSSLSSSSFSYFFFDSSRGCKINQGVAINSKEPDVLSFGKYTDTPRG